MALLRLKDGRNIEYLTNDVTSDKAILFLHGTPSEATSWKEWLIEVDDVLAISTSRAGYGLSDRHKGRTVADDLQDQQAVLDHLIVKKFVAIGWSGGGPHAINMSRDSRCAGVISIAGVGEYGNDDLDFLAGMGPENVDEFGAALKGESAITEWMNQYGIAMKTVSGADVVQALGGLISEADKKVLTKELADDYAASTNRSVSVSMDGWIDDDLAFVQKFGYDLSKIDKPIYVWQGDQDFMVPHEHSKWLAKHIPTSKLNFIEGHGDFSLGVSYRNEILRQARELLR